MPMSSQASRALKATRRAVEPSHDPSLDYLITSTAAIWQGAPAQAQSRKPSRPTRWARLPLVVSKGRCLGLRAPLPGGEEWQVCVEASGLRTWLPIKGLLSQKVLAHWVKTGF